jgi:hypothetical protein
MAGINKHKLVLNYRGVKVYHSWKNRRALTFWYALTPGHDAEEDGQDFDVRALPEKYTQGLLVEDDYNSTPPDTVGVIKKYADLLEAHKTAIQRAIDDGYDLLAPRREASLIPATSGSNGLQSSKERLSPQERLATRAQLHSVGGLWLMEIAALVFVGFGIWNLFFHLSDEPLMMLVSVCFFGACAAVIAGMLLWRRG